jgi:prolyl-tRNA editing enzyme YbaK/EbsC (Cys-tRNA(Pro) deacylase)
MSVEDVKKYLDKWKMGQRVKEPQTSSATVEEAAKTIGVAPERIAKTLSLRGKEEGSVVLIVCAGDAKIDNGSFKRKFGLKPRMLSADEVFNRTGHQIGGVCPFDIDEAIDIYLDISMKRFSTVFPACGSSSSYIEMTIAEMEQASRAKEWVDVCKEWKRD